MAAPTRSCLLVDDQDFAEQEQAGSDRRAKERDPARRDRPGGRRIALRGRLSGRQATAHTKGVGAAQSVGIGCRGDRPGNGVGSAIEFRGVEDERSRIARGRHRQRTVTDNVALLIEQGYHWRWIGGFYLFGERE